MIETDHTIVIIVHDLLYEKLKKYTNKYDDNNYFKFCFNVDPGKYKISYNWKYKINDNILIYCKISKI